LKEILTLRLAGGPTAPARARTALGSLDPTLADLRDDVHLLVSELVSNSVLHAAATHVELYATTDPAGVRIEVADPGPGFDESDRREPSLTGEGGFGLLIVDKVANRWGTARNGSARVWFEIDRDDTHAASGDGRVAGGRFPDRESRFYESARG
jgi:anti-sigma regulatory factor (Ser/Thr protein kinase)